MARPKSFTPDDALAKAASLFRQRGYHGASIDDLIAATGISRQSLYDTFGDKSELFVQCLQYEFNRNLEPLLAPRPADSALGAIQRLLIAFVGRVTSFDSPGSLLVSAMNELPALPEAVANVASNLAGSFLQRVGSLVERASEDGVLPARLDPAHVTALLSVAMMGLSVIAKYDRNSACIRQTLAELNRIIAGPAITD